MSEDTCLLPAKTENIFLGLSSRNQSLEVTTYTRNEEDDLYSVMSMHHDSISKLFNVVSNKALDKPALAIFLLMKNAEIAIGMDNLDQIVLYTYQGKQYEVEAFTLSENTLSLNKRIRFLTNKVRSNTANFLKDELKLKSPSKKLRILQIIASDIAEFPINADKVDQFDTYWMKLKLQAFGKASGPIDDKYCPQPCGGPIGVECIQYNDNDPRDMYCPDDEKTVICPRNLVRDSTEIKLSNYYRESIFSDSLHYGFRDHFLTKYQLGINYIANYYYVGQELKNQQIPSGTLLKTQEGIDMINNCITILTTKPNSIVISDSAAEYLIDLVSLYEPLSHDSIYQQIMKDLKDDISRFKGQTSSLIISQL